MAATDPTTNHVNGRRAVLAIVSLVLGGIMIAAASIGISVGLDSQARHTAEEQADALRAESECRSDARDLEFKGLQTEMSATTTLITFAIRHPNATQAELGDAVVAYQDAVDRARTKYDRAKRHLDKC